MPAPCEITALRAELPHTRRRELRGSLRVTPARQPNETRTSMCSGNSACVCVWVLHIVVFMVVSKVCIKCNNDLSVLIDALSDKEHWSERKVLNNMSKGVPQNIKKCTMYSCCTFLTGFAAFFLKAVVWWTKHEEVQTCHLLLFCFLSLTGCWCCGKNVNLSSV